MPVIATSSPRFSHVVKYEFEPSLGICRDAVVFNDTAQTLSVGTVLGKVTATGKYRLALSASSDGSQVPAAIYIADSLGLSHDLVVAASTDTTIVAMTRGYAILSAGALILGTGITASAVKTAFMALNSPIFVEATI